MRNTEIDYTVEKTRWMRFTSSQMERLTGYARRKGAKENNIPGDAFETYCDEVFHARLIQGSIEGEAYSRPMAWGEFVEAVVFEKLGLEWSFHGKTSIPHSEFPDWWSGRPDCAKEVKGIRTVGDIKCPQLKAFAKMGVMMLSDMSVADKIDYMKKDRSMRLYYWQLVSGAEILDAQNGELIIYCPTFTDLQDIKARAMNIDEDDLPFNRKIWDYRFIAEGADHELPHITEQSLLPDLISFEFEIPQEDRDHLRKRVEMAVENVEGKLNQFKNLNIERS